MSAVIQRSYESLLGADRPGVYSFLITRLMVGERFTVGGERCRRSSWSPSLLGNRNNHGEQRVKVLTGGLTGTNRTSVHMWLISDGARLTTDLTGTGFVDTGFRSSLTPWVTVKLDATITDNFTGR